MKKSSATTSSLRILTEEFLHEESLIREGGDSSGKERQKQLNRLTARERLHLLLDDPAQFFEIELWAAHNMYTEWGSLPAAGMIAGIGTVSGRSCMIIINDATVKAGAMFPQSVKKLLRAQNIAFECRLPVLYLVDSSGVFLPLQEDIFPDEDDFGRIFRNNALFSAAGIPQIAAIMGNCIAGGGYLPVLCDKLLMTKGSGLYLAGPALVKAAIGQKVGTEELGGAKMHSEISGTVDFLEPDDPTCIKRMRSLVSLFPKEHSLPTQTDLFEVERDPEILYDLVSGDNQQEYDVRDLLRCIVDKDSLQESKAEFGKTIVTAYAKISGIPVGIVANQRKQCRNGRGEVEVGGVLYSESADKAARFVLDCNQIKVPLIFIQDVVGFMVGRDAEQSGIIRSGAKLVNAVSNSIVPKITLIVGHSFGAGNYALCGKAYDPRFILAWPNAQYAVMGAEQAANTLFDIQKKASEKRGKTWDSAEEKEKHKEIMQKYTNCTDIRYGAARGWVDAIIAPHTTRDVLTQLLQYSLRHMPSQASFHTGVIQV